MARGRGIPRLNGQTERDFTWQSTAARLFLRIVSFDSGFPGASLVFMKVADSAFLTE